MSILSLCFNAGLSILEVVLSSPLCSICLRLQEHHQSPQWLWQRNHALCSPRTTDGSFNFPASSGKFLPQSWRELMMRDVGWLSFSPSLTFFCWFLSPSFSFLLLCLSILHAGFSYHWFLPYQFQSWFEWQDVGVAWCRSPAVCWRAASSPSTVICLLKPHSVWRSVESIYPCTRFSSFILTIFYQSVKEFSLQNNFILLRSFIPNVDWHAMSCVCILRLSLRLRETVLVLIYCRIFVYRYNRLYPYIQYSKCSIYENKDSQQQVSIETLIHRAHSNCLLLIIVGTPSL